LERFSATKVNDNYKHCNMQICQCFKIIWNQACRSAINDNKYWSHLSICTSIGELKTNKFILTHYKVILCLCSKFYTFLPCFFSHIFLHQPVGCVGKKEDHDQMNAPWDHANPGQGPPVLDTVTQS
jgi:hypothetical protein